MTKPPYVLERNVLDAALKLKVVACAENTTNRGGAAKFFIVLHHYNGICVMIVAFFWDDSQVFIYNGIHIHL